MIHLATKVARTSEFKRAKMGAVVAKAGRPLAVGVNSIRHCRMVQRRYPESLHAEQAAIAKLLGKQRSNALHGATLFVSRVTARGTSLAAPCEDCLRLAKAVGIKRIIYTTNDSTIGTISLSSMLCSK